MRPHKRVLLLDIGNSTTESALMILRPSGQYRFTARRRFLTSSLPVELSQFSPEVPCIVSSVVPHSDTQIRTYFKKTTFINYKSVAPWLRILLPRPAQIGADRLMTALAASQLYGKPCLIVDSGTATTFCLVNVQGGYEGGNIVPGLGISSKALADYTAKIPLILVKKSNTLCGKSTRDAVQSGLYWGHIYQINGFIRAYRAENPGLVVVGTGKGLEVLQDQLDLDSFDGDLILKGLAILAFNAKA